MYLGFFIEKLLKDNLRHLSKQIYHINQNDPTI
jgi:hypothetical protein